MGIRLAVGMLALLVVVWWPSAAHALSFSTPTNFGVGDAPTAVATGDFNGDSDPDLAVANSGSDNVSILLGGPNDSFSSPTNIGVGDGPESVAVGDFNGDSDPDLAVTNLNSDNVSILLGGAGGSFGAPTNFADGSGAHAVAIADFNGDLDPDLAVVDQYAGEVSILLGGAGGSFGAPTTLAVGDSPLAIVAADFNGDSDPDLAVATSVTGDVSVFLGSFGASFGAPTSISVGNTPLNIAVADFNGDSDPDLAVVLFGSSSVAILLGGSGGSFSSPTNLSVGSFPRSVAVGDINRDSDPDLVVANTSSNNVSILFGDAGGSFTQGPTLETGDAPFGGLVSDFDGDAYADIAVTLYYQDQVSIIRNFPEPDLAVTQTGAPDPVKQGEPMTYTVTVSNAGPGTAHDVVLKDDVAYRYPTRLLSSAPSQGSCGAPEGTLGTVVTCALGDLAEGAQATLTLAVVPYDFGSTNHASVSSAATDPNAANNSNDEQTQVIPRPQPVFNQTDYLVGDAPGEIATGDFNGDSDPDLAVTNVKSDTVSILLGGPGGTFTGPTNFPAGDAPLGVAVDDFNGDHDPDLAICSYQAGTISILVGGPGGTFTGPTNIVIGPPAAGKPRSIAIGDFNRDSDPDLALALQTSNTVKTYLGSTGATFTASATIGIAGSPEGIVVSDFNGDSDPDLTLGFAVFAGDPGSGFSGPSYLSVGLYRPFGVAAADFNGDSDPDLAVMDHDQPVFAVLTGGTGATFGNATRFEAAYLPPNPYPTNLRHIAAADLNGDGDPDLALTGRELGVTIVLGSHGSSFTNTGSGGGGDTPRDVVAADFDGDGDTDLASSNELSDTVSVMLNATAKIIVRQDTSPDDPQDFSFTAGGDLSPASFQLDDDGNSGSTLSNQRTFNGLAPGSGYSLAQSLPAGWDLESATCDDGSSPSNIDVSANETVTCTFVNTRSAPGYARPKGASPINAALVPAYQPCQSQNASHGEPLSVGSCSPPVASSSYLTIGSPDANGQAANSTGLVTAKVLTEAPINLNNGDQSDVAFTVSISDVREAGTLADYGGELRASFTLRLTDRFNGSSGNTPAAATDSTFGFGFSCVPTPSDPDIGSTCSAATTADAVMAGVTPELKRAVWQLGQVQVFDGGADGDADTTGDNTLFETQGLFAP